ITGNSFTYNGAATAGTYQFLITDNNNCNVETNEIIVSPTVNPQATAVVTDAACFGFADGSVFIDVDENFGVAPYTVSFDGSAFTATRTYSGLAAGTYTYIVRDSRGCEFTANATVGEPLQILSNMTATDVTCNPATGASVLGSVDVTITQGGVPNFTYTLYDSTNAIVDTAVSASTTHTFSNLDFGDYYVRIIDANGCESDLGSVRVSSNPFLTLTASPAPSDCVTGGTVEITASGGSGNYDFEVYDGGAGPTTEVATPPDTEVATFTGLNPGQTYIIKAEDTTNGCVSFLEVAIPPVSSISLVVDTTTDITCVAEDDGIMTFTVDNYDTSVTSINWEILNSLTNTPVTGPGTYTGVVGPGPAGGPQTATVNQIPPGDYVLVVREASAPSCTTTATFRITEPSATTVSLISQIAGNCFSDAEVSVRASGGTPSYSYAYVIDGDPIPTVFPEGQTFTLDPAISLNWDIYAQDSNGCVSTPLDVTISVDASPEITTSIANTCATTDGNFSLDVRLDALGISPYRISVDGGAPQATSWTNIGDIVTVSGLSSGNHTVQVLDANGCGEIENITIFPPLEIIANVTADDNCNPANSGVVTVTANGGSGVYTFTQISPAGASNTTGVFNGLTHSIAYTFEVEDDNTNCTVPVTITLPAPMDPIFTLAKTDVNCFGGNDGTITVNLNAGNIDTPYLYSLDGGTTTQTSNIFTGLVQGTYNVTVISDKGCQATLPITVDEPSALDIAASASPFTCDDAVSTVTVTINNDGLGNPSGTGPYQYSFNGGAFSSDNTFTITYGSPNVTVTVRDDNGCTDTESVAIPVEEEVTAVIAELQDIDCDNGEEIIQINASNGSGNYVFTQLPSGNIVADPTNIIITAPGTYVYQVTDTTTNCSVIVEHVVAPYDLIDAVATVTSNATCSDGTDGTIDVTITGYTGTFDYVVLDSAGNDIAGTNDSDNATSDPYTFTVSTTLGAGTYTVSITETADPLCITETNPVTIMAPQPLALQLIDNVNANCNQANAIVTVQASGGTAPYTYGASQSGTGVPASFPFDNTIELDPLTATAWDIYVRDANSCIISVPLAVTIGTDTTPDISLAIVDECADQGSFAINVSLDATNTGITPYALSVDGGAFQSISGFVHTFNNLSSGNHTVQVLDANGCGEIENITIEPELQLTATPNTQPTCGVNDGIIDFTILGGSGSSNVQLLRTDFSDTGLVPVGNQFTGVAFGDYIVRVTDNTLGTPNCFADAPVSLEEPTPVTLLTTTKTDVSCFGSTDGTISVNLVPASSGVNDNPPYVFEITDGTNTFTQNNGLFTGLPGGTYDITVTSNRNCVATDRITINVPLALDAAVTDIVELSCNPNNGISAASIEVTITAGTGTADYFYSVNGGSFVPTGGNVFTYTTTSSGNYDIVIRDARGCLFVVPTQNIQPLNTFTVGVTSTPITCISDENVVLTVNESNPTGHNYTFELLPIGNPTGNLITNTATTATFEISAPGSYTFRTTNNTTGCYVDTIHTIAPYDLIEVSAVATTPVTCYNDNSGALTITITGYSGGYDYEVFDQAGNSIQTGSDNTPTLLIGGLNGGNYYVNVRETDATSTFCSDDSNIVTIVSPDAELLATPSVLAPVTCTNDQGAIAINIVGGYEPYDVAMTNTTTGQTYAINDILVHTFTGLSAGTFDITVTDNNNCIRTYNETLVPATPVSADITATPLMLACYGDTNATVSAISVTDGSGSYEYRLNQYAAFGDTTPIFSSGAQTSADFNGLGAGVYSITVVDGWNCDVTTNQVEIQQPTEIQPNLVQSAELTCTNDAELILTATEGTAPYFYYDETTSSWEAFNNGNSHVFSNIMPGSYQFVVRDVNDCEVPLSNQITVDPIPPLTIEIDDSAAFINCTGEASATIIANVTGGLGNYSYELYADAGLSNLIAGPQASNTFSGLPANSYFVRVVSQDCEETSPEILIIDPAPLQIDREESTDVTCSGLEDGTITVEVSGGTGEILYAITPNLNQFDDVNTFDDLAAGVYDVIAQDRNGCFIAFQFTIEEPQPLVIDTVSIMNEICEGDEDGSIEIEISGGTAPYSAAFNSNADTDFVQDQTLFTDLAAGTYVIFVRDAQGCEQNIIIEIESGVNLNATVTPIYECTGDTPDNYINVVLEDPSIGSDVLYGLDSNPMQLEPNFTNMAPGLHTLTIAHANGCINIVEFEIQNFEPLTLVLEQNNVNEITAVVTGGLEDYTYYFDGNDNGNNNVYYINRTDTYTVRVVDANGCEAIAQIEMEFIDIEIPNFFTPDGDGTNDTWMPDNLEGFPEILIILYDRYGRKLGEMGQDHTGWDGKYQGHELPTGDYWYVIKLNGANDEREFVGHFTLYR
ncbi:T9SS type B sorting domain-containing protein, partial [Croceitalea marina]